MAIPFTKLTLATAVANAATGYRLLPQAPGDFAPTIATQPYAAWVAGIADLDGDLLPDVVIGAPGDDDKDIDAGRIFIELSHTSGTLASGTLATEIIIDGVTAGDLSGAAIGTVSDLDGDGLAEILIGSPGMENGALVDAGAAFVIWGMASGSVDLGDPANGDGNGYVINGQAAGDRAGQVVASIADQNGDSKAEILVGASGNDAGGVDAGAAYVVWGKSTDTGVSLTSVAAGMGGYRIIGQNAGDGAGQALATLGDQNADGKADILVGAAGNDAGGLNAGAAYVVFGKATGSQVDLDTIAAGTGGYRITGATGENAGSAITGLGDINGDGISDMLVGASGSGKAYVVFGKNNTSEVLLSDVAAGIGGFVITPEFSSDLSRLSVTQGGDFNRDGIADIVIGTPTNNEGGTNAGAVYIVWGGDTHNVDLAAVSLGMGGAKIVGSAGSLTGSTVAVLADSNGDGTPDLLIGSPGAAGESVSVVYAPNSWQPDTNIYGTNAADVIDVGYGGLHTVGAGDDAILGLNGNDTIHGGGGNDSIEGGAGTDTLFGDEGNDTLDGGTGNDTMSGAAGDDTFKVDSLSDVVQETDGEGTDTVIASVSGYTLTANVENLQLNGFSMAGTGNDLGNTITGTGGNDTLNGGLGADTLIGGFGNDSYIVDNLGDLSQEAFNAGTDTVSASLDWTLTDNIENLILTGLARVGTGNGLNNTLTGTSGNDTLDGGAGNDTLVGGFGDDTYLVDSASDVVQEANGAGNDKVIASTNYTLLANIESLQLTAAAVSGTGNDLANTITGTSGNNSLNGGLGADTLVGGLGDDTYYVENLADVVQEGYGEGTDTVIASINDYQLGDNLENLQLSGTALSGHGNSLANTLTGTSANNILDGGAGADTLVGGLGDDSYLVDDAADSVQEQSGAGIDTVIASVDFSLAAEVENLQLTGAARIATGNDLDNQLTGTSGDDQLFAGLGNDTLDGGLGADLMVGGGGDDIYYIDNVGDSIQEVAGEGNDTVYVSVDNWVFSDNIENVRLVNGAHTVTGNSSNNTVSGTSGDDTIDGGEGDDTEIGGDGDDILISAAGTDTLAGGSGDDRYVLKGGRAHIEDFLGHDTIDASEATGDSSIDLSSGLVHVENEDSHLGAGGTTVLPLDVQFLQDLSGSFGDDIAVVQGLIPQIVSALQAVQANSAFGSSTFVDKPISPFGASGEWVYNTLLPLTTNAVTLTNTYNSMVIRYGNDEPEAQLESLMQLALHSAEVGFRPDSARFVVLFTDAPYHQAGDGVQAGITTPNNGDAIMDGGGIGEDYPYIAQVQAALAAANIIPIFAIANNYESVYQNLVTLLGRGQVVTLTPNSSNVVTAITSGLAAATTTQIEDAVGGVGNDTVVGNVLDNALIGNGGDDHLDGGSANDTLTGGTGDDVLTGGTGGDTFKFSKGDGKDQITDDSIGNTSTDVVHFTDVASTDVLAVSHILNTDKLLLVYGSGDELTIDGFFGGNPSASIAQFQFSNGVTWTRADVLVQLGTPNDAPVLSGAVAVLANGLEDTSQLISAVDLLQGYTDANGDTLAVSNLAADHGTLANNGDGTWTFTPAANYNGAVTLTYNVTDGNGGAVAASLAFNLAAVNDNPELTGTPATLVDGNANAAYSLALTDLLAGYSDADGDTLAVSSLSADSGTLTDNGDGTWTLTPVTDFVGAIVLSYNIIDGNGGSAPASLSFSLAPVVTNSAPALTGTAAVLAEGTEDSTYTLHATDLLAGYTDADGDTLAVSALVADNGALTDNGDGTWTFTPTPDYNGAVTLSYEVVDGVGGITAASQSFNLAAVNDAPQITATATDPATVTLNTVSYTGGFAFSDADADDLHTSTPISAVGLAGGTLSSSVTESRGVGAVSWQYTYNLPTVFATTVQTKTDSFVVAVADGHGGTADQTFSVDVTTGTSAANTLTGSVGNDILLGGAGNDTLNGVLGTDVLIGGTGNDTYLVDAITSLVVEKANEGTDLVNSNIDFILGDGVENLTLLGTAVAAIGNGLANTLTGNAGNNSLDGGAGNDKMLGGLGDDTYYVDSSLDVITEAALAGNDTVISTALNYTLASNIETLVLATGALTGTGNSSANTLIGNEDNNTLNGGSGADSLSGDVGDDLYIVDNVLDVVSEGENAGIDQTNSSVSYTLADNVENLLLIGSSAINGTGNALANQMTGNSGNNVLDGGLGADTLSGGNGNDTYIVDDSGDVVDETGTILSTADLVKSSIDYTLGNTLENLTLLGTAVTAIGNGLANTLTGNAGNNSLDGGAGNDKMLGGLGDDTYYVDSSLDVITEATLAGNDTVISTAVSYTLASNIETLVLATGALTGTGNSSANTLIGNGDNNTLNGGSGADSLSGGLGDDLYIVDNILDVVSEGENAGIDQINSSVTYTLADNVENLVLTGTSSLKGTGNTLANQITGNSGNNVLDGGLGADTLIGGDGNDTYIVDDSGDVVLETGIVLSTADLIKSSIDYTLGIGANVENLMLTGAATLGTGNELNNVLTGNNNGDTLAGGDGADSLIGGSGNDTLIGGEGADILKGNGGNDTFVVNITALGTLEDTVTAGVGMDTIRLAIGSLGNYAGPGAVLTAASTIENYDIAATLSAALSVTGNALNNTLTGNAAANTLKGLAGNDVIDGGDGDDVLVGGAGNDVLLGGDGADVFWFDTAISSLTNKDTISDFISGQDQLHFSKAVMSALTTSGQFIANDPRFWSSADGLAHDATDRLIYNTNTGELNYDSNGSVAGGIQATLVVLTGVPSLADTDIFVI